MRYKHSYLKGQFKKLDRRLQCFLVSLECFLEAIHHYEIEISSLKREGTGFHPKGHAADLSIDDMPTNVLETTMRFIKLARSMNEAGGRDKKKCPRFEYEYERKGKKNSRGKVVVATHLHIELDDGEPVLNGEPVLVGVTYHPMKDIDGNPV